jgi:hypothetical protein
VIAIAADDAAGQAHMARCLALPGAKQAECDVEVSDHMVGGRYCSGNVRLFLDAQGKRATECIPQAVVEKRLDAQAKAPLPSRALAPALGVRELAIGGAVVLVLGYLALR